MKPSLIDTDILSLFFRNHPKVVANFTTYLNNYSYLNISIITYYEILSGLKHRDSQNKLTNFLEFISYHQVFPLTQESVSKSAEIYAQLRQKGTPIDDIDLLIAGVAIANNLVLITHNTKHFQRIEELIIEDWCEN
jgi:tRNA(fMet)-specific endonuclease VapC